MLQNLLTKVFGKKEDRDSKKSAPLVEEINRLESQMKPLSDDQLKAKTPDFRQRLANGTALDDLLPEAFAVVRETAVRTLGQRHYNVQLVGGVALHRGAIAEMKTGEGKTLASTLPTYLNALPGDGVHVATVNDYLARRDADWMGEVYRFLGLSVGLTLHGMSHAEKRTGYQADITYGVHSEFGFDYLWDNKAQHLEEKVQRPHNYAILDEVDSILVDEARTPLIIAEPSGEPVELYQKIRRVTRQLKSGADYEIDEKGSQRGTVALTDEGVESVEQLLGLDDMYSHENMDVVHHVNQALVAETLYKRDVDYVVKDGEVVIIDSFTGRMKPGQRYSEGLHQALEAKERVKIVQETQTGATISYQYYFRKYKKLAGMTGTAATEANEFAQIYNLDVVVVPTNMPLIRQDLADQIYLSEDHKYQAVIADIIEKREQGRPVLVGTISIENSEKLGVMLKGRKIRVPHQVLNAKEHAREADIVAQAGVPANITIATNMAGRGVDILLGGNPDLFTQDILHKNNQSRATPDSEEWQAANQEAVKLCEENKQQVIAAGGLHIIGTERHESRRIDNQLRGRAGRQGDPGSSRFYLSLEDDLMRKFGHDRMQGMMEKLNRDEIVPIEHPWITKAIGKAQKRVEDKNFEFRKNVLKFDDVMDTQRETIYGLRNQILSGENLKDRIWGWLDNLLEAQIGTYLTPSNKDSEAVDPNPDGFKNWLQRTFVLEPDHLDQINIQQTTGLREQILETLDTAYQKKEDEMTPQVTRELERLITLDRIDSYWKDHLYNVDYLKEGIYLRGYGGKDPIVVFKNEAYEIFELMQERIQDEVCEYAFKARISQQPAPTKKPKRTGVAGIGRLPTVGESNELRGPKVGRNAPCPCGSGKKYKKCCG